MSSYLLVHGAWHSATHWNKVEEHLTAMGHRVHAIDLPGSGLDAGYPQAYLRGDSARIVSDIASTEDPNRRRLTVALYRGTCVKQIPFTTVRIKSGGWIVESVDLSAAGNPARPCEPGSE